MPQYAILIFEQETPNGIADIPPEILEEHGRVEARIKASGGSLVSGFATMPSSSARAIRDDVVTDGPFIESKEALAGFFIIEARDLEHASEIGRFVPIMNGGVEVRPLMNG